MLAHSHSDPVLIRVYEARSDEERRVVINNSQHRLYEVREFSNGDIQLSPRSLVEPEEAESYISERTLKMMDDAIQHLNNGISSQPALIQTFLHHLSDEDRQEIRAAHERSNDKEASA
jgi:hypothetical protein